MALLTCKIYLQVSDSIGEPWLAVRRCADTKKQMYGLANVDHFALLEYEENFCILT